MITSIKDLQVCNSELHWVTHHSWSTGKVLSSIEKLSYSGEKGIRDIKVERASLPKFVETFYPFVFSMGFIPDEMTFFELYLNSNFDETVDGLYVVKEELRNGRKAEAYDKEAIKARVLRSYPSLIRDFHFFLLATESGKFDKVFYSMRQDLCGVDIMVELRGVQYQIALFVDSHRGRGFKRQKYYRHANVPEREICVPLNLATARKVGRFYLYDESHIDYILQKIALYEKEAN